MNMSSNREKTIKTCGLHIENGGYNVINALVLVQVAYLRTFLNVLKGGHF